MKLLPQIFGILAVITFLLSYQQKNRRNILALNAISRVFYIIQYIMLGAYAGATLDVLGTVSSIAAGNKENRFINKRLKTVVITINLFILLVGLLFYKNTYSIFFNLNFLGLYPKRITQKKRNIIFRKML